MDNQSRADRADEVLNNYASDSGDIQSNLIDLLSDILILENLDGDLDFEASLAIARMHFEVESLEG